MRLIFDLESDGLLDSLTKIHSLVLRDADDGEILGSYSDASDTHRWVSDGLDLLAEAEEIIGHNVIKFDIPALQKVYPGFSPKGKVTDTLILARLWKNGDILRDADIKAARPGFPGKLYGAHSLEAWGMRLGLLKGGYTDWCKENGIADPWAAWCPEMQAYCETDTAVTLRLLQEVEKAEVSPQAISLEHRVAFILARQERRGFAFDAEGAYRLEGILAAERASLEDQLRETFKPWWKTDGTAAKALFTPKGNSKQYGYVAGAPLTKVVLHVFEPNSRADFADRLKKLYGWEPKETTETGLPKVDESTLGNLPWPEAKLAARYFTVQKRLGQLATGKEAWLKHLQNGRIHGSVNTLGAHTGRMTHSNPNLAQVPSVRAPYGHECRALFMAGEGYVLVGMDAAAIELRNLAGFMSDFDKGAYVALVLGSDEPGVKEAGGDLHSINARALGLDPKKRYPIDGQMPTGRDAAKKWFYAYIYGAGDAKLALLLGIKGPDSKLRSAGRAAKAGFVKALPALGKLVEAVQGAIKKRGYLFGLDGRRLYARSPHAALNTLLQSAGAVFMKQALVELEDALIAAGLTPGIDYEFVANVHDEIQMEVLPQYAELVGKLAADSVRLAGLHYDFPCPLAGNFVIGKTWADTH